MYLAFTTLPRFETNECIGHIEYKWRTLAQPVFEQGHAPLLPGRRQSQHS